MSNATELTSGNFESTVAGGVTLVDFWAEWCAPCRMMTPVLDQLAEEFAGRATVAKVNVDNEPDLAANFQVSSIPTLLVIKDGEMVQQFIGVTSKNDLKAAIEKAIG